MSYKAIIFDLDGTLLNTIDDLAASINYALKRLGYPLHTTKEIQGYVGNGMQKLVERSLPAGSSREAIQQCLSIFSEYYLQHMSDLTAPYPGILPLLEALKAEGRKLAIVSNKMDAAVQELKVHYFGTLIDIACGTPPDRKKPDPFCVVEAISRLKVPHSDCIYVGDSHVDVETARNAGIPCIGVAWGFAGKKALEACGPEYLVERPEEIPALLKEGR